MTYDEDKLKTRGHNNKDETTRCGRNDNKEKSKWWVAQE